MQRLADLRALLADLPADGSKLRAGRISDLVLGKNRGKDPFLQIFIRGELLEIHIQNGRFLHVSPLALGIRLGLAGGLEDSRNAQKLLRAEAAAEVGAIKRCPDIVQPAERRRTFDRDTGAGSAGFSQKMADFIRVRARTDSKAAVLRRLRRRMVGKHCQDLVQLQLAQGFFILFIHKYRFLFCKKRFIKIKCIKAAFKLREQIALRRVAQFLFRLSRQRKGKQLFIRAGDDIPHRRQRRR